MPVIVQFSVSHCAALRLRDRDRWERRPLKGKITRASTSRVCANLRPIRSAILRNHSRCSGVACDEATAGASTRPSVFGVAGVAASSFALPSDAKRMSSRRRPRALVKGVDPWRVSHSAKRRCSSALGCIRGHHGASEEMGDAREVKKR